MQLEEEEGREALVVGVAMGGGEGDSTAVGYKEDHSLVAPPPLPRAQRGNAKERERALERLSHQGKEEGDRAFLSTRLPLLFRD